MYTQYIILYSLNYVCSYISILYYIMLYCHIVLYLIDQMVK